MTARRILWIHSFIVIILIYLPAIGHFQFIIDFLSTPDVLFIRLIGLLIIAYLLLLFPLLLIITLVREKPGEPICLWYALYGFVLYVFTLKMMIPRID